MKNRSSNWARLFVFVTMALILILTAFGGGMMVGADMVSAGDETASLPALPAFMKAATTGDAAEETSPTPTAEPDLVLDNNLFDEAMNLLEDQFYGNLPIEEDLTYNAIRGVVDRLGDRNTTFVDPETATLFDSDMEGHFEGIGARVNLAEGGGISLEYLFPEQPAEKAGLRVGDVILKVNGEDVTKLDLTEAISKIRGPGGSEVVLTIVRDEGEPYDVKLTRARIEIPVVEDEDPVRWTGRVHRLERVQQRRPPTACHGGQQGGGEKPQGDHP